MTQRRTPFRPRQRAEISQTYNDGVVTVFAVYDEAESGLLPVPSLTELVTLPYQERKVGIKRYYEAKQNQIQIEKVLRVPRPPLEINNQDVAQTENGKRYRIDLVQLIDDVYPPSLDLTLKAYKQGVVEQADEGGSAEEVTVDA